MSAIGYTILVAAILMSVLAVVYFRTRKRKYLVFSSVGDINQVSAWLDKEVDREFDLVLYYYGDEPSVDLHADLVIKRKGMKFENFRHFLDNNSVRKYRAIWVVDDDIVIDTASINKMFRVFDDYGLLLAQPSFNRGSKVSWPPSFTRRDSILRYTNFVENGVAIFSSDVIPLFLETFSDAGTGYGVDYVWPSLLHDDGRKIAVIDCVSCDHPVTENSSLDKVVPRHLHMQQGAELMKKYGLLPSDWSPTEESPWPKPFKRQVFSGVPEQPPV